MHIDKKIIEFLIELKSNNNKEWFDINRKRYEEAKELYIDFVKNLIYNISLFDNEIAYLQPKDCIFRINRDIRFSYDKSPYKPYFGCHISKGGRKSGNSGYYLHLEPGNFFTSGGVYQPSSDVLKEIRSEIYNNPENFLNLINDKKFKSVFGNLWGEKLQNVPRGFDKNFEYAEYLKYKDFVPMKQLKEVDLFQEKFLQNITEIFRITYELNKYLNKIINN